jgi:hypothetical protein
LLCSFYNLEFTLFLKTAGEVGVTHDDARWQVESMSLGSAAPHSRPETQAGLSKPPDLPPAVPKKRVFVSSSSRI